MKLRSGFVSNSSSSSFVVNLNQISKRDLDLLLAYPGTENSDDWSIYINEERGVVEGFTIMDNCGLSDYLKRNDIDQSVFEYKDY